MIRILNSKNFSLFTLLTIALTLSFSMIPNSSATIVGFDSCSAVGGCIITTNPPNPVQLNPDNGTLSVWNEVQNFVLTEDLRVDRVADPSASFIIPDGNGYKILAGTTVSSHYVQWDNKPGTIGSGTVSATMVFDSDIFAFITADQKMFDSDAQLGLPGLNYNNFNLRGLEPGDTTSIVDEKVTINWSAGSPGDWTRLITAFSPSAVDTDEDGISDEVNIPDPDCVPIIVDGVPIFCEEITVPNDNCPLTPNPDQTDTDGDGIGDACDNAPPIAVDDIAVTDEDTSVDISVLDNDSDVDSEITIVGTTDPSNGSVTINGGIVTYTPNENFNGNDSFTYTITDGELQDTATVTVTVNAVNDAPVCSERSDLGTLWPPNHKMKSIDASLDATDEDGDELSFTIIRVLQDEPVNEKGDGKTSPDAEILDDGMVELRAERSGNGDGRLYFITVEASDGELSCTGTVTVGVPHDKKSAPLDSGDRFNSIY